MSSAALSHVRVIDLTHYIAGPYCTKLMAGFGAEVIKVERPETGDKLRGMGSFFKNEPDSEKSIPFLWLNTGKKSVTLNLKEDKGRETLKRLVKDADVLVENFSPRVLPSLGLNYEVLKEINPELVMTSISNFGQTGPYRDYKAEEIEAYAMSGLMYMTGETNKKPLGPGPQICQYTAGLHAYIATLLALFQREITDQGQHLDISIMECGLEHIEMNLINYLHMGKVSKRAKDIMVPWDLYPCQDGHAAVICAPFRHWLKGAEMFQEKRLFEKKYRHARDRITSRNEVEDLITPWLSTQKKRDVFQAGQDHKLAFGYLASIEEALKSPQHQSRQFFEEIGHPVVGKHKYCGAPFKMSETPWKSYRAPLLGEHNKELLRKNQNKSLTNHQHTGKNENPNKRDLPLKGVRIVDLTHSWSGPHGTRILADFGAEVIRVEYARRMCPLRGGRTEGEAYNKLPMWFQVNRNKCSITLDLKLEQDRKVLRDLIEGADVFIENARGGVMDMLGFGYSDLIKIKPDIIMLSMAAFGNTGPYATYAGYGATLEAMSGIRSLTAYNSKSKPHRIREMDVISGLNGVCAVLTALLYHKRTGNGQHVDLAQMEVITHSLIGDIFLEYVINGTQRFPLGNRHWKFAPQGCYQCKGEDKWVAVTVRSENEWRRFCEVLGHQEWKNDLRFISNSARMENHDDLNLLIEEWTIGYTHYEVMEILQRKRIPAGAVLDVSEISNDPNLKERGYFVNGVNGSDKPFMGMPFKLSKGVGRIQWRGPDIGHHNQFVLCDILGRSIDEVKPINKDEIGTAFDPE